MAVTVVGTTKGGAAAASSTSTVTSHASTQTGDVVVIGLAIKGATDTITTEPSGPTWTKFGPKAYPSLGNLVLYSTTATANGAATYTFSFTSGTGGGAASSVVVEWIAHTVRGVGSVEALSAGINGSSPTGAITTAAVTTSETNEYILRFVSGYVASGSTDEKTSTWTSPATLLANAQGTNGTGTGISWISASSETGPSTAGSVAGRDFNPASSPPGWAAYTVGVKVPTTTPPSNTGAPVISGTASVGSVLSVTTAGTWDQTVTRTYQWQRDSVDITGNTASSYTLVSGDAGHTIRVVETATNGASVTSTANSSGIAVPSAPVNTVAPVVTTDGTPATGETVTVNTGTWTGTGISYAYQWYRGTSPISGETTSSYTLALTDEGANISARVTATNGGAPSGITADSNVIVPAVTAPISDASFLTYLSGGTGNTDPLAAIGGARGGTISTSVNNLFGPIPGTSAQIGGTFFRVIYVRNTHTLSSAASCKLFLEQQFSQPGMTLAVAVPSQGVNTTVPALSSQVSGPTGVTWTSTTTSSSGLAFGNLGPGDYRGVYVRLTIAPGTVQTPESDAVIAVEGSAA